MEWLKILGLCLSCFSLGMCTTNLLYTIQARRSRPSKKDGHEWLTDADYHGCDNCKHEKTSSRDLPCRDCDIYQDKWEARQ